MSEMKDDRLQWWRDARFGMFIHWGIYSAYEGYYGDQEQTAIGEWIQYHFKIPVAEYRQKAAELTLENFDADFYAELAHRAGMRYMVLTSKHHDGFAMFDSKAGDYNIVKLGPSHRDPLQELAEANARHGVKTCCYYSQSLDFEDPDGQFNDWDYDPDKIDFDKYLNGKCRKQLTEILTQYGPLGLIWFDVPFKIDYERGAALKKLVNTLQPDCLVSGRIAEAEGLSDYGSFGDNQLPNGKITGDWETAATLNHTWGYKRQDNDWKSSKEIIETLCTLLSKGANYLLNIGPKADGSIPEATIKILSEVGDWMDVNEESVHGTQASPFAVDNTWGWCSSKGDVLYLYVKPDHTKVTLSGLKNHALRAYLLRRDEKLEITETHHGDIHKHTISLPESSGSSIRVVKLQLDDVPEVVTGLFQQADGQVIMPAYLAGIENVDSSVIEDLDMTGASDAADAEKFNQQQKQEMGINPDGVVVNWCSTKNKVFWEFELHERGEFEVELRTIPRKYQDWIGGHQVKVSCSGQALTGTLHADTEPKTTNSTYFKIRGSKLGTLQFDAPGVYRLEVEAVAINPDDPVGLSVTELILKPKTAQ